MATAALVIGAVASAAGAGIAGYSAYQQGQTAQRMAAYNMQVAQQEAVWQQYQAVAASRAAENQAKLAENQAGWANYNASVEDRNAGLAENAATEARWTGEEAIRRRRMEGERQLAAIRAAQGAGGIAASGSALAVLGDSAGNIQLEALDIGREAGDKAMDFNYEAEAHRAQAKSLRADAALSMFNAKMAKREAKVSLITGRFKVAQTLQAGRMGLASGSASATAGTLGAAAYGLKGISRYADYYADTHPPTKSNSGTAG